MHPKKNFQVKNIGFSSNISSIISFGFSSLKLFIFIIYKKNNKIQILNIKIIKL